MSWPYSAMEAKSICDANMVDPGTGCDEVPRHSFKAAPSPTSAATVETQDKLDTIIQMLADLSERVQAVEIAVSNLSGHPLPPSAKEEVGEY